MVSLDPAAVSCAPWLSWAWFRALGEANAAIAECVAEINARPFKKLSEFGMEAFVDYGRPYYRYRPAFVPRVYYAPRPFYRRYYGGRPRVSIRVGF